jgi:hypothetical protein
MSATASFSFPGDVQKSVTVQKGEGEPPVIRLNVLFERAEDRLMIVKMMMRMRIRLFGQLGLYASSQGCETSKRTTAGARLRGRVNSP